MTTKETYLGDGLYASFDGLMITLRANGSDGDDYVYLEPQVFDELVRFAMGHPVLRTILRGTVATQEKIGLLHRVGPS